MHWEATPRRRLAGGSRIVGKVAGLSEIWMTGTLRSTEPDPSRPNPFDPRRWPYGYDVDWDEPADAGVPVRDVLGARGASARAMMSISREDFVRCYRALHGTDPPRQD